MKNSKSILYLFGLLIFTTVLSGCAQNSAANKISVENKIYGTWEYSVVISDDIMKESSEEPMPDDFQVEMKLEGTQTYNKEGTYTGDGEFIMTMSTPEGKIPLRFHVKDAGDWSLHENGKDLRETATDISFSPIDDFTKSFIKQYPDFTSSFEEIDGEAETSRIVSISDSEMIIQLDDPKIEVTLTKKN